MKQNPFPITGTFSLEGLSFIGDLAESLKLHPSCALPPLQELQESVRTYLNRFSVNGEPPEDSGHCFTLQGDHGTGKTHALAITLGEAIRDHPNCRPLILYAKIAGPDFGAAFIDLVSDLKSNQGLFRLREIGRDALKALLHRQMGGKLSEPETGISQYLKEAAPMGRAAGRATRPMTSIA